MNASSAADSLGGRIGYEVKRPEHHATDDVAFSHSLNQMSGRIKGGHTTRCGVRWTACLRKLDGRWLVTHEQDAVLEPDASACAVSVKVSGPGCSLATSAAILLAGSSGHEPTGGWRQIDADEFNLDDPQTVEDGLAEGSTFDRTRHKVLIVGVSEYIEGPLQITVELPSRTAIRASMVVPSGSLAVRSAAGAVSWAHAGLPTIRQRSPVPGNVGENAEWTAHDTCQRHRRQTARAIAGVLSQLATRLIIARTLFVMLSNRRRREQV